MASVAVLGATSWGVTLSWLLAEAGTRVRLVCRSAAEVEAVVAHRGLERLPEVVLGERVEAVTEPGDGQLDGVVVAVPTQTVGANLGDPMWNRDLPVLCAAKGIEVKSRRLLPDVITSLGWTADRVSVLSGPNLAREIGRGLPAASVVASLSLSEAARWQSALMSARFRVYASQDVTGVALAGALKNVVAIAAGTATELGHGTNAVAAVVTRGLAEITRLGAALGADPLTFQGLAGVGDLTATCFSPLSRNQRLGALLARGLSREAALAEIGEAVEGVPTAAMAVALAAQVGVEVPIASTVADVLEGKLSVNEGARALLERPPAAEAASAD